MPLQKESGEGAGAGDGTGTEAGAGGVAAPAAGVLCDREPPTESEITTRRSAKERREHQPICHTSLSFPTTATSSHTRTCTPVSKLLCNGERDERGRKEGRKEEEGCESWKVEGKRKGGDSCRWWDGFV